MRKTFVLLLITIILVGCNSQLSAREQGRYGNYIEGTMITRVIDYDAQVVCWISKPDSISCLPISQTSLSGEKINNN